MCCIYSSGSSPPDCVCCCSDISFAESHWLERHTFHFLLRVFLLYVVNLAESDTVIFHVQRGLKPQAITSVAQTSMTLVTRKIFASLSLGSRTGWCHVRCVQKGSGWEVKLKKLTCWMLPYGSVGLGWEASYPLHTHRLTNQSSLWRFRGVLHLIPPAVALADWLCLCYAQRCQQTANIFFWGGRRGNSIFYANRKRKKKEKKIKMGQLLTHPIQLNLGWNVWDGVARLCSAPLLSSACCKQGCEKYSRRNHENPSI